MTSLSGYLASMNIAETALRISLELVSKSMTAGLPNAARFPSLSTQSPKTSPLKYLPATSHDKTRLRTQQLSIVVSKDAA